MIAWETIENNSFFKNMRISYSKYTFASQESAITFSVMPKEPHVEDSCKT